MDTKTQPEFTSFWNDSDHLPVPDFVVSALGGSLTSVEGISVGHWSDHDALTGCTVVLCDGDYVCGVDVRGGGAATREVELLAPCATVEAVQALVLTGGSAMGLSCVDGVMNFLREQRRGFHTYAGPVPIVPAAALYDLGPGRSDVFPNASNAYSACRTASADCSAFGSVGAGTGASVGKLFGHLHSMRGGLGTAGISLAKGLQMGCLAVVNALGDVRNPWTGQIVSGMRSSAGRFADSAEEIRRGKSLAVQFGPNTVLAVVATNAALSKVDATRLARMAQAGVNRSIWPSNTPYDGDLVFAISTGELRAEADMLYLGSLAADLTSVAILNAVTTATQLDVLPAAPPLFSRGQH